MEIIRSKPLQKNYHYLERYEKKELILCHELHEIFISNQDFQEKLHKWKNGINPITNRKITIGGKVYDDVKYTLINLIGQNVWCNEEKYQKIKDIDIDNYAAETMILQRETDIQNNEIKLYNTSLIVAVKQIDKLQSFLDFVEFDGHNYGMPPIVDGIHRENDCMGVITDYYTDCTCSTCENWNGCGTLREGYRTCNKCDYKVKLRGGASRRWWK